MNIREVFANVHEHFAKLRKLYFATYHMYACITVVLCTLLNLLYKAEMTSVRLSVRLSV